MHDWINVYVWVDQMYIIVHAIVVTMEINYKMQPIHVTLFV